MIYNSTISTAVGYNGDSKSTMYATGIKNSHCRPQLAFTTASVGYSGNFGS
jgi:hypothetical protein